MFRATVCLNRFSPSVTFLVLTSQAPWALKADPNASAVSCSSWYDLRSQWKLSISTFVLWALGNSFQNLQTEIYMKTYDELSDRCKSLTTACNWNNQSSIHTGCQWNKIKRCSFTDWARICSQCQKKKNPPKHHLQQKMRSIYTVRLALKNLYDKVCGKVHFKTKLSKRFQTWSMTQVSFFTVSPTICPFNQSWGKGKTKTNHIASPTSQILVLYLSTNTICN